MLKKSAGAGFHTDITCRSEGHYVRRSDFNYYDNDGFELTVAERKIYQDNYFPLSDCLNHWAFQTPWLELQSTNGLHLDHCMLMHRCDFAEDALAQIQCFQHPNAAFMSQSRPKWGLDFAMHHLDNAGDVIEILHIELDDYDFTRINDMRLKTESWLLRQDWLDLAQQLRNHSEEWRNLSRPEQDIWKSKYLIGSDLDKVYRKVFQFR